MAKNPPANAGGHRRCGFDPWVTKIKLIISLAQMILYLDKSAVSHLKPDIQGVNRVGGWPLPMWTRGGFTQWVQVGLFAHTHRRLKLTRFPTSSTLRERTLAKLLEAGCSGTPRAPLHRCSSRKCDSAFYGRLPARFPRLAGAGGWCCRPPRPQPASLRTVPEAEDLE